MAINEILPFAGTDNGTNLLTQAQYNADAQRLIGNAPGVARLELVNKVLRQTSLMSAGLAQFIADLQASNMVDTLTPAQIATALRLANVGNGTSIYAVAGGTANAITATFSPARPAHQEGIRLYIKLTANNTGEATIDINDLGAVGIIKPGGIGLAAGDLKSGDIICIIYNGVAYEIVAGIGSAATLADITTAIANDNAANLYPRIGSTGPASCRNKIRNPRFQVNQRNVSGTVTLAAGAFGHDGWKAGAGGCTYTFSTSQGRTTLNITAGSLVQTVDGIDLAAGANTYTLSWGGTCQGKIGAGSYGASGVTGSATGGTNINVEFGTGTLYGPQFEIGSVASQFEYVSHLFDEFNCQRFLPGISGINCPIGVGHVISTSEIQLSIMFKPRARVAPTGIYLSDPSHIRVRSGAGTQSPMSVAFNTGSTWGLTVIMNGMSGLTTGYASAVYSNSADFKLLATGCEL